MEAALLGFAKEAAEDVPWWEIPEKADLVFEVFDFELPIFV